MFKTVIDVQNYKKLLIHTILLTCSSRFRILKVTKCFTMKLPRLLLSGAKITKVTPILSAGVTFIPNNRRFEMKFLSFFFYIKPVRSGNSLLFFRSFVYRKTYTPKPQLAAYKEIQRVFFFFSFF